MLRSHRPFARSTPAIPGLGSHGDDEIAGWAARSILAGHDMVIVEGGAATSTWVYRRLLEIACRGDDLGRELRDRIFQAYGRILLLKTARENADRVAAPPEDDLVKRVVGYLADRGAAGPAADGVGAELAAEVTRAAGRLPQRAR